MPSRSGSRPAWRPPCTNRFRWSHDRRTECPRRPMSWLSTKVWWPTWPACRYRSLPRSTND
eukprot:8157377-Alexandrium_andersonii.AAC.1